MDTRVSRVVRRLRMLVRVDVCVVFLCMLTIACCLTLIHTATHCRLVHTYFAPHSHCSHTHSRARDCECWLRCVWGVGGARGHALPTHARMPCTTRVYCTRALSHTARIRMQCTAQTHRTNAVHLAVASCYERSHQQPLCSPSQSFIYNNITAHSCLTRMLQLCFRKFYNFTGKVPPLHT